MGGLGAGYGGRAMMRRTSEVREFGFLPISSLYLPGVVHVRVAFVVDEHHVDRPVSVSLIPREPKLGVAARAHARMVKRLRKAFKRTGTTPVLAKPAVAETMKLKGWRRWHPPDVQQLPRPVLCEAAVVPECTICVAGWVSSSPAGFVQPFESVLTTERAWGKEELYCLKWESKELIALHNAIASLVASSAGFQLSKMFVANFVSAGLVTAMVIPSTCLFAFSVIDNVWSVAMRRADKAGLLLAQSLVAAAPSRPVRLVGFSMGARLIFSCLLELARCGHRGVVSEVVLLGAPVSITLMRWCSARSAVAGRFINGYCHSDWVLGTVYRTSGAFVKKAAGLQAVSGTYPEANIEDVDLLARGLVDGHTDYAEKMGRILSSLRVPNSTTCESLEVGVQTV